MEDKGFLVLFVAVGIELLEVYSVISPVVVHNEVELPYFISRVLIVDFQEEVDGRVSLRSLHSRVHALLGPESTGQEVVRVCVNAGGIAVLVLSFPRDCNYFYCAY